MKFKLGHYRRACFLADYGFGAMLIGSIHLTKRRLRYLCQNQLCP